MNVETDKTRIEKYLTNTKNRWKNVKSDKMNADSDKKNGVKYKMNEKTKKIMVRCNWGMLGRNR